LGLAPAEKVRPHAAGNPKTTTFDPMNNKQLQKEDILIAAVAGWLIWFFAGVAWGLMS